MPESSLVLDPEPTIESSASFRERLLLIIGGAFLLVSQVSLIVVRHESPMMVWHWLAWVLCVTAGHVVLRNRLPRRDPLLFPVVMLLAGWGLILIQRLAPAFAVRQTLWLVIATAALLATVLLPGHLRWLSRYRYLWLIAGITLLALTIGLGTNPSGAGPQLWLGFSNLVYFQPSELLKVLLIVFLASYLAENRPLLDVNAPRIVKFRLLSLRFLAPLVLMWGLCVVFLVWQQDLGAASLFFVVFLAMLYLATNQTLYVLAGGLMLVAAGVIGYFAFGIVRVRLNVWLDPWASYKTTGFQIVQSLLAISAGGVFGQGIAQGSPTYIPVVHSDFVFAAIGEEWGLLGTLAVTAGLAFVSLRALRQAAQSESRPFRAFLSAGIGITIAVQSLLIMGGVTKLIPLTGITLPLLSYGGSSLVANFLMVGLLLVLSGDS